MSEDNVLPPHQASIESIVTTAAQNGGDINRLKVEDGLAKARGLNLDGSPVDGDAAAKNLAVYGADSPRERYCKMMPAINLRDLAKDWGVDESVMRVWATRGKWDQVRAAYLQHVPLAMGGRLATGDLVAIKDQYIRQSIADGFEIQRVTMERIAARQEQQATKEGVVTLDKTSKEHLNDVLAYDTADKMIRTALQLPTKYSATMSQSTVEKKQVTASVLNSSPRGASSRPAIEGTSTITTTTTQTIEAE